MRAWVLASGFATCLVFSAAAAPCDNPKARPCVPFVGCVEASGERFEGESYGHRRGPLFATSSLGARCQGRWKRTLFGVGFGVARFACDDGRQGSSVYPYFECKTGTAVGSGTFKDGTKVRFWAGWNLDGYFAARNSRGRERVACGLGS